MRLELRPVWHVNSARRDVIDGGEIVVAKRGEIWTVSTAALLVAEPAALVATTV